MRAVSIRRGSVEQMDEDLMSFAGAIHCHHRTRPATLAQFYLIELRQIRFADFVDGSPHGATRLWCDCRQRAIPGAVRDRELQSPLGQVCNEAEFRARSHFCHLLWGDSCVVSEVEQGLASHRCASELAVEL